jgi:hypothetical protein
MLSFNSTLIKPWSITTCLEVLRCSGSRAAAPADTVRSHGSVSAIGLPAGSSPPRRMSAVGSRILSKRWIDSHDPNG